jgi:hypothetical protein
MIHFEREDGHEWLVDLYDDGTAELRERSPEGNIWSNPVEGKVKK